VSKNSQLKCTKNFALYDFVFSVFQYRVKVFINDLRTKWTEYTGCHCWLCVGI